MDLNFTKADQDFRNEVREFIEENFSSEINAGQNIEKYHEVTSDQMKEGILSWHKTLYKKGWIAPHWPVEYGGIDWSITQRYIWDQECANAGTTPLIPFGLTMLGPVIIAFGNDHQKDWVLKGILSGDDWWCQGYSEPGAGSDLASLRTKAERDGDHYVVNGHKIWTTLAQYADWMFCLVRTSNEGKPQEGISFLLIDMNTPGIEVKPIITVDGGHEVNEVFLEDVRVPVENLVGEENMGWTIAKFLLGNERTGIAGVARSKKAIDKLKDIANLELNNGEPLMKDSSFNKKITELEVDLTALEYTELRTLAKESQGQGPGVESSILKIKGTEIQQKISELTLEAIGNYASPYITPLSVRNFGSNYLEVGPEHTQGVSQNYFGMRKTSIYGGSNEIQRNIIAKMVLGL